MISAMKFCFLPKKKISARAQVIPSRIWRKTLQAQPKINNISLTSFKIYMLDKIRRPNTTGLPYTS